MNTSTADERGFDARLQRLLDDAWPGPDCPPPEAYLPGADLPEAERARIEAHALTCPACGSERALAQAFESEGPLSADASDIVAKLRESTPWRAPGAAPERVVRFGRARAHRGRWHASFLAVPLAMAAALMLAVGAMLYLGGPGAPPIGAPGSGLALRGSEIEIVEPAGEIADVPTALSWQAVPKAASYRVTLLGVDGEVLWSATVRETTAALPYGPGGPIHPAVLYRWQVEAIDANGSRVAWSKPTQFRVEPDAGGAAE